MKDQLSIPDFREVLLWQKANKQLIRRKVDNVEQRHHRNLQKFFLRERLFAKITGADIVQEMPLALLTDLSKVFFLNLNLASWTGMICKLIPGVLIFDLDKATAEACAEFEKYDNRIQSSPQARSQGHDDDDDQELFQFIGEYLDLRKKQGRDLGSLISKLYSLKASSLERISRYFSDQPRLRAKENKLQLDLRPLKKRREALDVYIEAFCKKAGAVIQPIVDFSNEWDLYGLLEERKIKAKKTVMNFIDYELLILQKESQLMNNFVDRVESRMNNVHSFQIIVLKTTPLSFLKDPFPEV